MVSKSTSSVAAAHTAMSGAAHIADPRAYLQERVTLYAKSLFYFFVGVVILDAVGTVAMVYEESEFFSPTRFIGLGAAAVLGLMWWTVKRWSLSERVLRILEASATVLFCTIFAATPLDEQGMEGSGHIMVTAATLFVMAFLMVRAAIVPSSPWRTLSIGFVCSVPLALFAHLAWDAPSPIEKFSPSAVGLIFGFMQGLVYSVVSAIISKVIYGLQAKVRAAMQLGQYTLEEKIGEGGMGSVYRARHALLRRPTAVKLLPLEKAGEHALVRFEREVQQTSRLTHPNTVAIYDYGHTPDGVFYYAMEYLAGLALDDLVLFDGPQSAGRVIHILTQAAEALAEAHDMGLIHRDIKPANIVLCKRGGLDDVVKVLDFGLVKDLGGSDDVQLSTTATITGTPLYIAPETLTDPSSIDGRTDLYALGGVAYNLLTAQALFDGKTIVEICGHHLHTEPTPPSKLLDEPLDDDLEAIVLQCLAKKPADRPTDALGLRDSLLACQAAGSWSSGDARQWWEDKADEIDAFRRRQKVEMSDNVPPSALTVALQKRNV